MFKIIDEWKGEGGAMEIRLFCYNYSMEEYRTYFRFENGEVVKSVYIPKFVRREEYQGREYYEIRSREINNAIMEGK